MYQEAIAKLVSDHLRTHIEDYLDLVNSQFTLPVTLIPPKSIEPASVVGGMMTAFDEILPQYGIDMLGKTFSEIPENLYDYEYPGQINGLVHSTSRQSVDQLVHRHAAAVEYFIHQHQYLHTENNDNYRVTGFYFVKVDFSGAEDLGKVDDRQIWLAGFSMDFLVFTSEDGWRQH